MPGLASMDGVSYGKAEPFSIPDYDYEPVRAIVKATDLTGYYDNLLDDAFERDEEDFTCTFDGECLLKCAYPPFRRWYLTQDHKETACPRHRRLQLVRVARQAA